MVLIGIWYIIDFLDCLGYKENEVTAFVAHNNAEQSQWCGKKSFVLPDAL